LIAALAFRNTGRKVKGERGERERLVGREKDCQFLFTGSHHSRLLSEPSLEGRSVSVRFPPNPLQLFQPPGHNTIGAKWKNKQHLDFVQAPEQTDDAL